MGMRTQLFLAVGLIGTCVVCSAPVSAQVRGHAVLRPDCVAGEKCPGEPVLRELFCRGGAGLQIRVIADPSPVDSEYPKQVRMALRYASGQGLTAGSCTWNRDFDAPEPPGEVVFDIEARAAPLEGFLTMDTATIRMHLVSAEHYWVFYHYYPGDPLALSHGPVAADVALAAAGQPDSAGAHTVTSTLAEARAAGTLLTVVSADATRDHFAIRFTAPPSAASVVVEYSELPPIQDGSTGRWSFATPVSARVWRAGARTSSASGYTAVPVARLQPGTTYYYVVTVPAEDARQGGQQYAGALTTRR